MANFKQVLAMQQAQAQSAGQWAQNVVAALGQYAPNFDKQAAAQRLGGLSGSSVNDQGAILQALLGIGTVRTGTSSPTVVAKTKEDEFAWIRRRVNEVCWKG